MYFGDFRGLTEKLDYLQWLGIDGIWLSPTMPSPDQDWGYDVSDYTDIDPIFGSLADKVPQEFIADREKLRGGKFDIAAMTSAIPQMRDQFRANLQWIDAQLAEPVLDVDRIVADVLGGLR